MNDSWHIPRASLGGSTAGSSNSSSKSHSNPPTVTRHSTHLHQDGHRNLALIHNEKTSRKPLQNKGNEQTFCNHYHNKRSREDLTTTTTKTSRSTPPKTNVRGGGVIGSGLKRGSRSSQGSTDSNNSSHSASSGSMLLTAANLERFVAIHNKQHHSTGTYNIENIDSRTGGDNNTYSTNLVISTNPGSQQQEENSDAVIEIDPNLHFVKTKDVDSVSIASSTHFTMVNGMGGPQKKVKEGICGRGHQITVLILTMSMFFLIGIMSMVYLLEMRAREMPQ